MSGETVYKLGGVHLPYCRFEWSKYRGATPRVVYIDCPADMYDQLKGLAVNSPGGKTELYFECPSRDGPGAATSTTIIPNVYILRIVLMNEQVCRVFLSDARVLLSRRVAEVDFNIRFGDGYLSGTAFDSYKKAIQELVDNTPLLKTNTGPDIFAKFTDFESRDGILLSGQPMYHGIDRLLDDANADITVANDGKFYFSTRRDISSGQDLPSLSAYSWHAEPGWNSRQSIISGVPRNLHVFYPQRHCIGMEAYDPIRLSGVRPELKVYLEQVYSSAGRYFTLSELLTHYGFSPTLFIDDDIARTFYRDGLSGIHPRFDDQIGSTEHEEVTHAIQDGWRVLWRVAYSGPEGHLGGFTDWVFGKINPDGSVNPAAVDCPWVEFCRGIRIGPGQTAIGSKWTINRFNDSHFVPAWDSDVSNGVIRLRTAGLKPGHFAHPGTLETDLRLQLKGGNAVEDQSGQSYSINGYNVIEKEPLERARFKTRHFSQFFLTVYVCATQRMPNNNRRWHNETVKGKPGGDIDYQELVPSGELQCIRDYVDPTRQNHNAEADGFGPYLNQSQITASAEARAKAWLVQNTNPLEGEGIAEGMGVFQNFECAGPVSEVTLMIDGPVIRTRIVAGNLTNASARERISQKRQAERKWEDRGVPIV